MGYTIGVILVLLVLAALEFPFEKVFKPTAQKLAKDSEKAIELTSSIRTKISTPKKNGLKRARYKLKKLKSNRKK